MIQQPVFMIVLSISFQRSALTTVPTWVPMGMRIQAFNLCPKAVMKIKNQECAQGESEGGYLFHEAMTFAPDPP